MSFVLSNHAGFIVPKVHIVRLHVPTHARSRFPKSATDTVGTIRHRKDSFEVA